ncbi:MAG: DNA metabolism protein, partial [Lachnospiraceae bacterium]
MTVYVCKDNFDSILCGVYDAWMSRQGHDNVRLELEGNRNLELFCTYQTVETIEEKAKKVVDAVIKKISRDAYELIYRASLSQREDRADAIYRFLIYGFHVGARVTDMLQIPAVFAMFEMQRNLYYEEH